MRGSSVACEISALALAVLSALPVRAQTNAPPASYVRSYVNDIPNQPLVTVTVSGASNVSCLTIEEDLPGPASPVSISGGGVWVPALNAIRWGPFFNTVTASVTYRLTGLSASYPVNGGSWMDGQWYFSPGVTMIPVLPVGGGSAPSPPPQLPAPIFVPLSGSAIPVDMLLGLPGWDLTLLNDTWAGGTRTTQNLPQQSAWFASGSSTNITANINALNLWNGTNAVVGLTYFSPNATTPVTLGVGDTLKATLNLVLTGVAAANTSQGLRIGLFDFADSTLSPTEVSADGFSTGSQGNGVRGYCLFQNMGASLKASTPVDIKVRTNIVDSTLQGTTADFSSLSGSVVSNNFSGFTAGRQYVLTLTLNRTGANSLAFSAAWLDTVTGGIFLNTATNNAETNFRFDGLAIRSQTAASAATNITLTEFKLDCIPQPTNTVAGPTNAAIYYTLDGSTPTTSSTLYTGAVQLTAASVVRAEAFATGWTPSAAAVAYYGYPAMTVNAQVTRSVNTSSPTAPMVTFSVTPGMNAACEAVTESLPPGLAATGVTGGGNYIASNNVVLWGPFFGTNALVLSYVAVGQPGTYPVKASWSVDGVGGSEAAGTNIVIASASGSGAPTPPPQVATPTFLPASGSNVPVNVTISCATAGASVYYTLDGSLPTQTSMLYSNAVNLASAGTIRAVAFTNGWTPSAAAVAYYGPPAATANAQVTRSVNTNSPTAPVVTFSVVPGTNASCVAVTESLPLGLGAANVTAGGKYISSNNVVLWGPFFGTNALNLSYQAVGQAGSYAVRSTWSVDGVSSSEAVGTNIVVASTSGIVPPTPPPQEPMPTLSPALASNLPVMVTISDSDSQAQIYFTTDGTLPTQSSAPYTGALNFNTQTTLRAVAFRAGYVPSVSAVGNYVPLVTTNLLSLVRSVSGNGTFLPSVTVTATPSAGVNCYSVTETIAPGLTPDGLAAGAIWNPANGTVQWGPYLDNAQRALTYQLIGSAGTYALAGQGSFNGYSAGVTGQTNATINTAFSGSPNTNFPACATEPLSYTVDINPAPNLVTVTAANGTLNWGDGTQVAITQPVMTFQKQYSASGTYTITITANWSGYTSDMAVSGVATKSDSVQVVSQCNPVIVTEPTNQVVFVGSQAQFSVNATSTFPMSFQWYFNQAFPFVSPSTFATLTLPDVTVQEGGQYSVVITNTYGSVTSSVVMLTVVTPLVSSINRNTNKSVTLDFTTLPNSTNRVWATTNLAPPVVWQIISTNIANTNGQWQFTDTNAIAHPMRYYRFSTP
jgi:hypothetical protein